MDVLPVDVSLPIARFAATARWESLPEPIRHEGTRALMNFLACCLAGASTPAIAMMTELDRPGGAAKIIGRRGASDALSAAWINAASANVLDFDDTVPDTIAHPTSPVAAPLLALAQTMRAAPSGRDLLLALILGIELQIRIGRALSIAHYRRGWHITSTCGGLGAALACGRLIGLSAEQLVAAMGGATAQAGGLVETLGTMSKSLGVGGAARAGLLSALMAERGMTGPDRPLEGRFGFLNVMGEDVQPAIALERLGQGWAIADLEYKPYPCGVVLNAVIDACMRLRPEVGDPGTITSVIVSGHPLLKERTDRPAVANGNLSQVSAQHAAAVVLVSGEAGPRQFSDAAVHDRQIRALAERVRVDVDDTVPMGAARVRIVSGRGEAEQLVTAPLGSRFNPMTDLDLEQKLRTQWRNADIAGAPDRLIDLVWTLDSLPQARDLIDEIP